MKNKNIQWILMLFWIGAVAAQQTAPATTLDQKYLGKVATIDATVTSLYQVISGEKGEERNWELLKYLFHPDAKMISSGKNREGVVGARYSTPDDYIAYSGKWLVDNGFFEEELNRVTEQFGSLAQVFSTYQTFHAKEETVPFMRGINSIQLLYDGERWWVINIYWTQETASNPIPQKYLPTQP